MAETNYISSIKTSDGKTYNIKDTDARKRMIETTWSNLKTLRDNSQLIAGMQYKITDYQCTTTQVDTQSAGHQFDIIVTADSTNKLNEEARATLHSGDTYFKDCKLEAWKIWYSIDNNTNRFLWVDNTANILKVVNGSSTYYFYSTGLSITIDGKGTGEICNSYDANDTKSYIKLNNSNEIFNALIGTKAYDGSTIITLKTSLGTASAGTKDELLAAYPNAVVRENGKGVIYRMIDEYNNDVAYDFKNIQYKRYKITKAETSNAARNSILVGDYSSNNITGLTVDTTSFIWCYTFTNYYNGTVYDATVAVNKPIERYNTDLGLNLHFHGVIGNIVKLYINSAIIDENTEIPVRTLNNVVFFGYKGYHLDTTTDSKVIDDNCGYAQFLYNTVDYQCMDITFQNECCGNNIIYCESGYFSYNTYGKTFKWDNTLLKIVM